MDLEQTMAEQTAEYLLIHHVEWIGRYEKTGKYSELREKILEAGARLRLPIEEKSVDALVKKVCDYLFGYGILQPLIEDDSVSDILVTRYDHVAVKKEGELIPVGVNFGNPDKLLLFAKLIVVRNGGKLNENHCFERVDDPHRRLRISASIPPRSVSGPSLSIRKHRVKNFTLEGLVHEGMLDDQALSLLRQMVLEQKNLIICGRGGAGKTTLLRAVLAEVPPKLRFLVCESETELYPENRNFIVEKIITREFGTSTGLSNLVRDGLSISLDGYCIGELVGEEAWEFLKASLTDHTTYATIHANGIYDVPDRLKMLINWKEVRINDAEVDRMIEKGLNYIIYLSDFRVVEIGLSVDGRVVSLYRRKEGCDEPMHYA